MFNRAVIMPAEGAMGVVAKSVDHLFTFGPQPLQRACNPVKLRFNPLQLALGVGDESLIFHELSFGRKSECGTARQGGLKLGVGLLPTRQLFRTIDYQPL